MRITGKMRAVALVLIVVVAALAGNAILVERDTRAAEPFAGGHVLVLDGPDLNVREYGPAIGERAVVLLHGYSASIEWWEQVAPALAAAGNRVVAIDLVGHGGSESTGDDGDFDAEGQARAVLRALDTLGIRQAALVAHSMGGHVATQLAQQEPGRVERVAVIDTQGGPGLRAMPMLAALNCVPIVGALSDRLRPIDAITDGSLQTAFAADYPVPALAHRSLERLTHRGVCRSTAAVELNDERAVADRLAALGKPILVIWGEHDALAPTATNVARFAEAGLRAQVIAGSGHSSLVEQPDVLIAVVAPFVARAGS
ncbi:alpha/beta fold hydrolase [Nocardia sp. NPDC056952]|uniref:alpha/beta fold hydrolase n=1 Tax=Nocardia sp. NPDC056952 TaxID=3345979 RepID=UPI003638AC82